MAAQPALAVKEVADSRDRWSPNDPFEYRTGPPVDLFEYRGRRALLHVCVVPACHFFRVGGKTEETSTLSTGTGGGAGC